MANEAPGVIRRHEGRALFGQDPSVYEAGRPQYPEEIYDALRHRCGLAPGARVLEVGPGTGLVTKRLLDAGASVLAVEPNPSLAAHLASSCEGELQVVQATFEAAEVPDGHFDLALAATSFHWVDQRVGMEKLGRVVRPGGSVALWWTLYQDPYTQDAASRAIEGILGPRTSAAFEEKGRPPFQLDAEHRLRDLERWGGFQDLKAEIVRTPRVLDAQQMRALFASVAIVLRRSPEERVAVLDAIERVVREDFDGRVERLFVTALYTGRRPENPAREA